MTTFACIACLCLVGGSVTSNQMGVTSDWLVLEPDPLISGSIALSDVNELQALLVTAGATYAASFEKLANRVQTELEQEQIGHVKREGGAIPRFVVQIESTFVPECERYVYRVQGAFHRPVTVTSEPATAIQAEVWRLAPVKGVAIRSEVASVVEAAVLAQVHAFAEAVRTARSRSRADDGVERTAFHPPLQNNSGLQDASACPFIASKSGGVFHRPDCRWAQNISADNRLGYKTREEAIQSGKRPCKSCKP